MMNSKNRNRGVSTLTLSLCLGIIAYSTPSAQGADPQVEKDVPAAEAQEMGKGRVPPCPIPMSINLKAEDLGPAQKDKNGEHTFKWEPKTECCQCLSGQLVLEYKALIAGTSNSAADAGNDKWYTPGQSGFLWPNAPPFTAGKTGSKTITLNAADLKGACGKGSFTIKWQDDTAITKATLKVLVCCVTQK